MAPTKGMGPLVARRSHPPRVFAVGRAVRDALMVFALGIVVCFVFFLALGAFSPRNVIGLTISMVVIAGLWFLRGVLRRRVDDHRDPRLVQARERRGF